jgi:radical SAM protein with 4Fe4S-binding SPASM domain
VRQPSDKLGASKTNSPIMKIGNPYLLQIHITSKCTQNCSYCYLSKYQNSSIPIDDLLGFLEQFKNYYQKFNLTNKINLTGGDIFLYRDLQKLLSYIDEAEHISKVTLMINSLYSKSKNEQILNKFKKKISFVQINTDVANKNDVIYLKKLKLPTACKIMLSANSDIYSQIKEILKFKKYNPNLYVSVDRLSPQTKGQTKYLLSTEKQYEYIKLLTHLFSNHFISKDPAVNQIKYFLNHKKLVKQKSNEIRGCSIPNKELAVFPDQSIKLCARISQLNTGYNLKNFDLLKYIDQFKDLNPAHSNCKNCKYKNMCLKGCLSTYFVYNKQKSKDRLCLLNIMEIEPKLQEQIENELHTKSEAYLEQLRELPGRFNLPESDLENLELMLAVGVRQDDQEQLSNALSVISRFTQPEGVTESWQELIEQKEARTDYYSLNTLHYRQWSPIGCSVSSYLMAQSILRKNKPPSRDNESQLVNELCQNERILLSDLMTKAVDDGFEVQIFSEKDYNDDQLEDRAEQMRIKYLEAINELSGEPNFTNQTGIKFNNDFFLKHIKAGKPILVNGVTENGTPHMYLFCGYRRRESEIEFLVSDPLDRKKRWHKLNNIDNQISPPFGKWAMVLSAHEPSDIKRELLAEIYKPIDDFRLGKFGENARQLLLDSNIPYQYLPKDLRVQIPQISTNIIIPRLQQALRQGRKSEILENKIEEERDRLDPEKMSLENFVESLKDIYITKINIQKEIAYLLSLEEDEEKTSSRLEDLIEQSREIEPVFFAVSSRIKDFIKHWEDTVLKPRVKEANERNRFLTPSIRPYHFWLDQIENISPQEKVRLFTNLDPIQEIKLPIGEKRETQPQPSFKPDPEKIYQLLERKVPNSELIDQLLIIDNVIEKFIEARTCFLHDLFATIYIQRRRESKPPFPSSQNELEEEIESALKNLV